MEQEFGCGFFSHFWKQADKSVKSRAISGVDHEPQLCHQILNMGLFKKPESAGNDEGHSPAGKFDL